jgi:hypothetical protein
VKWCCATGYQLLWKLAVWSVIQVGNTEVADDDYAFGFHTPFSTSKECFYKQCVQPGVSNVGIVNEI